MISRLSFLKLAFSVGMNVVSKPVAQPNRSEAKTSDRGPLPSWQDGAVKTALLDYVRQVTTAGSEGFIPPRDRIATFDNDGTLWCEQPYGQAMFVLGKVQEQVATQPELAENPVVKALMTKDRAYFADPDALRALIQLLVTVSAGMTQTEFDRQASQYLATSQHPTYGVKYTDLGYQPQQELLDYLSANGFQTWICTGGGIDFVRLVSESMYGIPPYRVIGSAIKKDYRITDGRYDLWRLPELDLLNDKDGKPVGIDRAIGQPPVFACGNVRSGGDIAMLTYSQSAPYPSLQLLINHDDGDREFAYSEPDNASLTAARQYGWQVVSMKNDWRTIFATNVSKP
jgi:phosphoserine phosphatase